MAQTALILGASGRFGRTAAHAFSAAGWQVRGFDRNSDTLATAAAGADLIVNAWNPAYPDWATDVPALTRSVIAAARRSGATVLIPGNVYVYGAATPPPWSAHSPHAATNPLGRIRIEMETAYRDAGVRTIVLRAGDFIDTRASGNWFDMVMVKKLAKGLFTYPGPDKCPHAWAFLPDMARAAVSLAQQRAQLPVFADIPFAGYTLTGQQIAQTLAEVMSKPVRLKRMSWLPVRLASPVWSMGRALCEMRYLWDTAHRLDPAPLQELLPDFVQTPVEDAFDQALQGLGLIARSTQTSRWRLAETAAS